MKRSITASLVASLFASAPLATAQNTWTVEIDGSGDFGQISQAVHAAADGDVILVGPGIYLPVLIEAKSLTIQGEGEVFLLDLWPGLIGLTVRGLAEDQSVHLRGLTPVPVGGVVNDIPALDLQNNQGPVFVEDCTFDAAEALIPSGPTVRTNNCASVTFARCRIVAADAIDDTTPTGNEWYALSATYSRVYLYDCEVRGGAGASSDLGPPVEAPVAGSPAVWVRGSTLYASGGTIAGGAGGGDAGATCAAGVDGAPALVLEGAPFVPSAVAILFGTAVSGGAGGAGGCGQPDGVDAPASQVLAGSLHVVPGVAPTFRADSPVDAGAVGGVHVEGTPGDVVFLLVDDAAGAAGPAFGLLGALQVSSTSAALVPLGALPASGALDLPLALPGLPPGVESVRFVGQALFVGPGGVTDGGASMLLVTDPAL